ncbi:MAG: hypothetical protein AAFX55_00990 [Bacteroidota bacterium]
MKTKEIYWLFGTTAFIPILNLIFYGIDGFTSEAVIDINVHDTYYVISNFHFMLILGVLVFFGVYLLRTLIHKFKNLTANLILMISIILLSIVLTGISTMLDGLIEQTSHWTVYPPSSVENHVPDIEPRASNLSILAPVLFYIQILLLVFLAYSGFKTGRNYKSNI